MSTQQLTGNSADVHASSTRRFRWLNEAVLVDAGVYLLALGGFYIGYATLRTLARSNGFPQHQAVVVAALADLAILVYSWKAKQEVEQGRSAWGIRLIVAAMSLATCALQLRAAWPHYTAVALHALAPAVWIVGHEMMLRGKLRDAKNARRQAQIAAGLRPAPLEKLRASEWLISPYRTFRVWRLMQLLSVPAHTAKAHLVSTWKGKRAVPTAWLDLHEQPAPEPRIVVLDAFKFPEQRRTELAPSQPAPALPQSPLQGLTVKLTTGGAASAGQISAFLAELPATPPPGRTQVEAWDYVHTVETIASQHGIECTGVMHARLLGVTPGMITKIKKLLQTGP